MTLSTHVLDTARGCPVAGISVAVDRFDIDGWIAVGTAVTDADGRIPLLVDANLWGPGRWRVVFDTGAYLGPDAFLPQVTVEFRTTTSTHHHVPLLLSPFGYSTYRGS